MANPAVKRIEKRPAKPQSTRFSQYPQVSPLPHVALPGLRSEIEMSNNACIHSFKIAFTWLLTPELTSEEIRKEIYALYIGKDIVDYVPNWPVFSRHGCLPLAQTCKQIHREFIHFFISKTVVRIKHFRLNRYLQNFYPLNSDRAYGVAKLQLLLPCNEERPRTTVPFVDLTHLFMLMVQKEGFTSTVVYPSPSHELALGEELGDLLQKISMSVKSVLHSIIAVRLVMARAGWNNAKPPTVDKDVERPALWFMFQEHSTLPGDWPWYGAHNLNHESERLWQQWLEANGAAGL